MGAINREVLFAQRIMRMFDIYFSMVRRSAAWASRESKSASFITTTREKLLRFQRESPTELDVNGHTFEPLFGVEVHLLRLCDLLQQILNHNPVVVPDIAWGQFDMKVALDNIHVQFAF